MAWVKMKTYLVIMAITLAACTHRGESTSTVAKSPPTSSAAPPTPPSPPPPADVAPTPPSPSADPIDVCDIKVMEGDPWAAMGAGLFVDAEPLFTAPPGTSLVASNRVRCSDVNDIKPGKPASPSLPAGSIYIGCATDRPPSDHPQEDVATIIEWDVARGRVLRSIDLPLTKPNIVRIATFHDNVYVASTMCAGETRVFALDADLRPRETRSLGISTSVSLEANEKYLAVSYRPHGDKFYPLNVELLDANHLTTVATTSIGSADLMWDVFGSPSDALEFLGDKLYVAGVPSFTKPPVVPQYTDKPVPHLPLVRVFAMSLPSLKIVGTYESKKNSYYPLRLRSAAGHFILTGTDKEGYYEEFTADLKPIRHDGSFYFVGTAFNPITGEAFSCPNLGKPKKIQGRPTRNSYAFWTGLEAACVTKVKRHILIGRLKDWPRGKRD